MKTGTRLSIAAAVVAVALSTLLSATVAFAAPITNWSGEVPARGAVLTAPTGVYSANASCTVALDKTTAKVTLDGVNLAKPTFANPPSTAGHWVSREVWNDDDEEWEWETVWVMDPDLVHGTVTAYSSAPPTTDGSHTVSVTLGNTGGTSSTDTWTYSLRIAPTLGAPVPFAGSTVNTTSPVIAVPASDNSVVASWTATVNGVQVASTYTAATGKVTVAPGAALIDDAANTVVVTIWDGIGLSRTTSWSFYVLTQPDMLSQVGNCLSCHPGANVDDDMGAQCSNCHGPASSTHAGTPSSLHAPANVSACKPCHYSSVTVEHARWKTHAGADITCQTCHASTSPAVRAAIAAGKTDCTGCHSDVSHEALHAVTVTPSCTGSSCHVATSLTSLHVNSGTSLTCDTCHKSTDPKVVSAISGGNKDCTACHDSAGHVPTHDTAVAANCAGSSCHTGTNLTVVHAALSCDTCHKSADANVKAAIASHNKDCNACHVGIDHVSKHTATVSSSCSGANCHSATNLTTLHAAEGCDACHKSADAKVKAAIAGGNKDCSACHDFDSPHGDVSAIHASKVTTGFMEVMTRHDGGAGPTPQYDVYDCTRCHGVTNLLSIHGNSCAICHASGAPRTTFTSWNKTCQQGGCHAGSLHDMSVADANHLPAQSMALGQCWQCHDGPANDRYGSAQACRCHGQLGGNADTTPPSTTPANLPSYAKSPVTFQLVATDAGWGVRATYYRIDGGTWTMSSSEPTTNVTVTGDGTHTVDYYSVDQADNSETTKTVSVRMDDTAPVTALVGTPGVTLLRLAASDTGSGVGTTYYSVDGAPWAVYGYFENLLGIGVDGGGSHTFAYYSVDVLGNVEASHSVSFGIPDVTIPSSYLSANVANTAYIGAQDYGNTSTGIKSVFYRLNGGAWVKTDFPHQAPYGQFRDATITVPADGSYHIDYYSVDWGGNTEAIKGASLTVDRVAPTLSCNVADVTNGDTDVVFSASDDRAGIKNITYYVTPAVGATTVWWQNSAKVHLTAPVSGVATYTVYGYTTDNAGNTSAAFGPKVITLKPAIDTAAPVTDPGLTDGTYASGDGGFSVVLVPSDNMSGVASINYQVDGGAWQQSSPPWAVVPTNGYGTHTVAYYSIDNVGNAETIKHLTITVAPFPVLSFKMLNDTYAGATWDAADYSYDVVVTQAADGDIATTGDGHTWDASGPTNDNKLVVDGDTAPFNVELTVHTKNSGDQVYTWNNVDAQPGKTVALTGHFTDSLAGIDTTAPVTTSDARSAYHGDAHIALTASDVGGSGVAGTHYQLDGGADTSGTAVIVAAPASGTVAHSLTFWSVDGVGNVESAHTVAFTVKAADGPVTTTLLNAGPFAGGEATITLDAVADAGVSATRYNLDGWDDTVDYGGAFKIYGAGEHTLEYWSIDNLGREEPHQTATITVLPAAVNDAHDVTVRVLDGGQPAAGVEMVLCGTDDATEDYASWNWGYHIFTDANGYAVWHNMPGRPGGYRIRTTDYEEKAFFYQLVPGFTGVISAPTLDISDNDDVAHAVLTLKTADGTAVDAADVWATLPSGERAQADWDGNTAAATTDASGAADLGVTCTHQPLVLHARDAQGHEVTSQPFYADYSEKRIDIALTFAP